jgi:hypothetical protein
VEKKEAKKLKAIDISILKFRMESDSFILSRAKKEKRESRLSVSYQTGAVEAHRLKGLPTHKEGINSRVRQALRRYDEIGRRALIRCQKRRFIGGEGGQGSPPFFAERNI